MHTAPQPLFAVRFPKADREYGQRQDLEKIIRFMRTNVYFLLSVSLPLSLLLPSSHTHTHSITHTTRFSQNTHGGERLVAGNVKLLCHVQSKSGSLTSCVCNAGMCVCSAHPMSRLAALSVWVLS